MYHTTLMNIAQLVITVICAVILLNISAKLSDIRTITSESRDAINTLAYPNTP